jgi:hypothetical protein
VTSSATSTESLYEFLVFIAGLVPRYLRLSLEEWMELTILGLKTMVMQGLLSFHHFSILGHLLRQHLQQQQ